MERSWHVDDRKLWGWGDPDRRFDPENRPGFEPFLLQTFGVQKLPTLEPMDENEIQLPPGKSSPQLLESLQKVLKEDQCRSDHACRLRHSFSQGYRDLLRLRQGKVDWSPDLVVYPENHDQVVSILQLAEQYGACIIPFGGGTNIFGMTRMDTEQPRFSLSLDTRRMSRLLEVDPHSRTARFQAGVFGPDLEGQLKTFGLTLGHVPDSFHLSTLGGWLATRSAGMFSSGYGRIEDMVLAIRLATPSGEIQTRPVPASSAGPDMKRLILGSEGTMGVITEASLKVRSLPEVREFETWILPGFKYGLTALHSLAKLEKIPTLVRLMDERQLGLMRALAPEASVSDQVFQKLGGLFLKKMGGVQMDQAAMLFVGYEGNRKSVRETRNSVAAVLKQNRGVNLGSGPAEKWYQDVFNFGLLRDQIYSYGILADASETATVWSNLERLYHSVMDATESCFQESGARGFISGHVSHIYPQGASLYFIFACLEQPGRELEQHREIRERISKTILSHGGTLSHHHGVGRDLKPYLVEEYGQTGLQSLQSLKRSLDPSGILNPGNIFD